MDETGRKVVSHFWAERGSLLLIHKVGAKPGEMAWRFDSGRQAFIEDLLSARIFVFLFIKCEMLALNKYLQGERMKDE